eukprot:CAMPEP_0184646568 /NCGR_PEP_ID=MMETSP0308-20130426/3276_1 /TAXON_ID=38269 /ORGANISM="Gloeochaete witrockiana, Strain SAG 46.84" /LENGTH=208 /DNA_ID=CAMNT_0027076685 /DNA_START=179 /DNA_END=805 /DNA_ORIENTATION=-
MSAPTEDQINSFVKFFDTQVGQWKSNRTYHYLDPADPLASEVERSQTVFRVTELDDSVKRKVLSDNERVDNLNFSAAGFRIVFDTVMEKRGNVSSGTNVLFLPMSVDNDKIYGDYLRDVAYEESKAIIGKFSYNLINSELEMITRYTKVTSKDSITMANPNLRIRRILNYLNGTGDEEPQQLVLAGFGIEQRSDDDPDLKPTLNLNGT